VNIESLQPTLRDLEKIIEVGDRVWYFSSGYESSAIDTEWEVTAVYDYAGFRTVNMSSVDKPSDIRYSISDGDLYEMSEADFWAEQSDKFAPETMESVEENWFNRGKGRKKKKKNVSLEEYADVGYGNTHNPPWDVSGEDIEACFIRVEAYFAVKYDKNGSKTISETAHEFIRTQKLNDAYSLKARAITDSGGHGGFDFEITGENLGYPKVTSLNTYSPAGLHDLEVMRHDESQQ